MNAIEELTDLMSRLPGLGKKSARRIAYHLLASDSSLSQRLANSLGTLHERIRHCEICGNFTESNRCPICLDPRREQSQICVVEQPQDISVIEASQEYSGTYHVLNGALAPLSGIGPDKLNIRALGLRLESDKIRELIIATNPTLEGDATALYLRHLYQGSGISITRLALGLPMGGDLEFADKQTLARSLRGRTVL